VGLRRVGQVVAPADARSKVTVDDQLATPPAAASTTAVSPGPIRQVAVVRWWAVRPCIMTAAAVSSSTASGHLDQGRGGDRGEVGVAARMVHPGDTVPGRDHVDSLAAGGQASTTSRIENYLGFPTGVSGTEFGERALLQAQRVGAEMFVLRHPKADLR
jgi:hypothetical protein